VNGLAKYNPERYREGSLNDPDSEHTWHFWSLHPGGAHFVFVDGNVRFIRYSIGGDVLGKLADRKYREVINEDF
jgi:prepilin-type processing-associated H-X9-DG protein